MNANEIILLAVKATVTALSRQDGRQLWSTKLPAGMRAGFVTLLCEEGRAFAYCAGRLHCLDLTTGRILWSNELPGLGYGLATLAFSDGRVAPTAGIVEEMMETESAAFVAASPGFTPGG